MSFLVFIWRFCVCQRPILFGRCCTHCINGAHVVCESSYLPVFFMRMFLLGFDKHNNPHANYSLGFLFPGIQAAPKLMTFYLLGVCLQPNTMAPLRPGQHVKSRVQSLVHIFYSCLDFICHYFCSSRLKRFERLTLPSLEPHT